jgi:hypothetical protein
MVGRNGFSREALSEPGDALQTWSQIPVTLTGLTAHLVLAHGSSLTRKSIHDLHLIQLFGIELQNPTGQARQIFLAERADHALKLFPKAGGRTSSELADVSLMEAMVLFL